MSRDRDMLINQLVAKDKREESVFVRFISIFSGPGGSGVELVGGSRDWAER